MSRYGRKQDPNKRALNKILRENKFDPLRSLREDAKRQRRNNKEFAKSLKPRRKQKPLTIWQVVLIFIILIVLDQLQIKL